MQRTLRPWITASAALTGAGLIAVTPVASPVLVQQRSVQLTSGSDLAGVAPYPEEDYSELLANTTANWTGLQEMMSGITNIWDLPNSVWTDGLTQIEADLATQSQELMSTGIVTDPFADAVLNPVSEVTLPVQLLLGLTEGFNAATAGATGVIDNMLPYFSQVPAELQDVYNNAITEFGTTIPNALLGDYNTALAEFGTIGTSLGGDFNNAITQFGDVGTQLGNILTAIFSGQSITSELTAIQTDFGNIFPTSELDTLNTEIANIFPASELTAIENDLTTGIFPASELTAITQIWDYLSLAPTTIANDFLNGYPVQASSTDPILSTDAGVTVPDAYTLNAPFTGTNNSGITPEFGLLTNPDAATTVNVGTDGAATSYLGTAPLETGTLASALQVEKTLDDELLTVTAGTAGNSALLPATVDMSPLEGPGGITLEVFFQNIINDILGQSHGTNPGFDFTPFNGFDLHLPSVTVADVGFQGYDISIPKVEISYHIFDGGNCTGVLCDLQLPSTGTLPTIPLGSIGGETVPGYTADLTQNDMAIVSSIGSLTAPPEGVVDTTQLGNFLAPEPVINLAAPFDTFLQDLTGQTVTLDIDIPLNWANLLGVTLNDLFTNSIGF